MDLIEVSDARRDPDYLDTVFKALGHITRRQILRLLAQRPHYPYELSKRLGFTSRVIIKHLEVLENAGIVETEAGDTSLGPQRTYYKLRAGFGLSTTILPNSFIVQLRPHEARITRIRTQISVPEPRHDVQAVKVLLQELEKVNQQLSKLEEKSMNLARQRGLIIRKIEQIMDECDWDDKSCQLVRRHINPVIMDEDGPQKQPMEKVLDIFEKRFSEKDEENQEVRIEFD